VDLEWNRQEVDTEETSKRGRRDAEKRCNEGWPTTGQRGGGVLVDERTWSQHTVLVKYKYNKLISEIPWTTLPDEGRGWTIQAEGMAAVRGTPRWGSGTGKIGHKATDFNFVTDVTGTKSRRTKKPGIWPGWSEIR
jgi:hypothetical protein